MEMSNVCQIFIILTLDTLDIMVYTLDIAETNSEHAKKEFIMAGKIRQYLSASGGTLLLGAVLFPRRLHGERVFPNGDADAELRAELQADRQCGTGSAGMRGQCVAGGQQSDDRARSVEFCSWRESGRITTNSLR